LASARAIEPTEKVEQGGLPAATGSHHGDRLTAGDVEIDAVDGHCLMLLRSVQLCSQASSQRKSAWSLSTMPSSSRAAFE
jgi:RecA-family ATPase